MKLVTQDKRKRNEIRDLEITKSIIQTAKEKGYHVIDSHQTVMIRIDNSPFRILVSRVGKSYQFYQLGGGHNFITFTLSEDVMIENFWMDTFSHKSLFESGHVFKTVTQPEEEDDEDDGEDEE